jgi:hypothetical protein
MNENLSKFTRTILISPYRIFNKEFDAVYFSNEQHLSVEVTPQILPAPSKRR